MASSLGAIIENGKIVETASQSSLSKSKEASANNGMDKDAFLQLLVAQMKYQDPMEPTSNTEYIAQYAQFSQVEQIQNMASSMNLQRASQLVGQEVRMKTTASSGETKYVEGRVDYVSYEGNKAYLSIDESLYSIDDLDTVVDSTYKSAYDQAMNFVISVNKLPAVANVSEQDFAKIDALESEYGAMNDYQRSYVAKDVVATLSQYIERVRDLRAEAEAALLTVENETAEEAAAAEATDTEATDAEMAEAAAEAGAAEA